MCNRNLKAVKNFLKKVYLNTWDEWYKNKVNIKPASLTIEKGIGTSGYKKDEDKIYIFVAGWDIEKLKNLKEGRENYISQNNWYIFETELFHEMIHEYQYKIVKESTNEGRKLYTEYKNRFSGKGHDELFFTAIAEKADYFDLIPEEFINEL